MRGIVFEIDGLHHLVHPCSSMFTIIMQRNLDREMPS